MVTPYTLGYIRNEAAEAKLYQIGPIFLQKRGGLYISEQAFFWGVTSVTFLGPGNGLSKMRGVFQKGGGILCFEVFF